MEGKERKEKVTCPYCGHKINVFKNEDAKCNGVFFKCKNKGCKKEFELKL